MDDLFDSFLGVSAISSGAAPTQETPKVLAVQTPIQVEKGVIEEKAKDGFFDDIFTSNAPTSSNGNQSNNSVNAESVIKANEVSKLSIDELFQRHLKLKSTTEEIDESKKQQNEEIVLFSRLDMNNPEDRERWAKHLMELSNLATEVRNRFAKASSLARESDAKAGRTVWDRERRGTNALNGSMKLIHPSDAKANETKEEKEIRTFKTKLNKLEQYIQNEISCGGDEKEIVESVMAMSKGKYSIDQVEGMIRRAKEGK